MEKLNQDGYVEFLKNHTNFTTVDDRCIIKFDEYLPMEIESKEVSIYKIKCAEDDNIIVCNKLDNYSCELVNISVMPKDFIDALSEVYPEISI